MARIQPSSSLRSAWAESPLSVDTRARTGDVGAVEPHTAPVLGGLLDAPARGADALIADEQHGGAIAGEPVAQVADDAPAGHHAGARDDDHRTGLVVEARGVLAAAHAEEAREIERVVTVGEQVERLLVEEGVELVVGLG